MNIGQKVRELRIAKNLTQEELADRSELSKGLDVYKRQFLRRHH